MRVIKRLQTYKSDKGVSISCSLHFLRVYVIAIIVSCGNLTILKKCIIARKFIMFRHKYNSKLIFKYNT